MNTYWALPNNSRGLYHLVIRNLSVPNSTKNDQAINRSQKLAEDLRSMNYIGGVAKIGGLDSTYGYREIDAEKLNYKAGKIKFIKESKWKKLTPQQELKLIKSGYLFVKWKDGSSPVGPIKNRLVNLINDDRLLESTNEANFMLFDGNRPVYAIVNGFLVDLTSQTHAAVTNVMGY